MTFDDNDDDNLLSGLDGERKGNQSKVPKSDFMDSLFGGGGSKAKSGAAAKEFVLDDKYKGKTDTKDPLSSKSSGLGSSSSLSSGLGLSLDVGGGGRRRRGGPELNAPAVAPAAFPAASLASGGMDLDDKLFAGTSLAKKDSPVTAASTTSYPVAPASASPSASVPPWLQNASSAPASSATITAVTNQTAGTIVQPPGLPQGQVTPQTQQMLATYQQQVKVKVHN